MYLPLISKYIIFNNEDLLTYYKQVLYSLLKEFHDIFFKELPKGLLPEINIDYHIDLIPCTTLANIFGYRVSWIEDDEIPVKLKEYLRMCHIRCCDVGI